jgi:hypothetical protein
MGRWRIMVKYSGKLFAGDQLATVSLTTVEFRSDGPGTSWS